MDHGQKSRLILTELLRRLERYQRHRKVRAPTIMEGRAGLRPVPSIVEKRTCLNEPASALPLGYVLENPSAQLQADQTRSAGSAVADTSHPTLTTPINDIQFGTANMTEYKTPSMSSATVDTVFHSLAGQPFYGWAQPNFSSAEAPIPQVYHTPGATSNSSGLGSVNTVLTGETMNMDLSCLVEAAVEGQSQGMGSAAARPEGIDMEIDWVCHLSFPDLTVAR